MGGTKQFRFLTSCVASLLVLGLGGLTFGVGNTADDPVLEDVAAADPPAKGGSAAITELTSEPETDGDTDPVASTAPEVIEEATPTTSRPTTTSTAPAAVTTTTGRANRQTNAASTPPPAGRPAAGTRVVEKSDSGGYFVYEESEMSGQGSSLTDTGFVRFLTSGAVVDGHGRVRFSITNESGGKIAFPDGLAVKVFVKQPDGTEKTYVVRDTTITDLHNRGEVTGEADFPLVADGQYSYWAEVLVEYR